MCDCPHSLMLCHMIRLCRALVIISCLLLASCAELRIQVVRGTHPVWLSTIRDDSSLNKLTLLDKGKTTPGNDPQFVSLDRGTQIYVTDYTTKYCQGKSVFVKVQVKDGDHQGIEGWICEAAMTHHKTGAL